jgi:hypothetical protein
MKRRYKTIFLITALVMIPVFFGLVPLNCARKLASGAPLSPARQALKCNPCPFHSLTSHPEAAQIDLSSVPLELPSSTPLTPFAAGSDIVVPAGLLPDILPLRC